MSWIERHQVLIAGLVLVALVVAGLVVLAIRGYRLYRQAKAQMRRVEGPVDALSAGLANAERRVDTITSSGQGDLTAALERVGARTEELRVLMRHAAAAIAVLRAPFRYLGR